MGARKLKIPILTTGVCRVCGCTELHGCDEGCSWVDHELTLCSACAGTAKDLRATMRIIAAIVRKYGNAADVCRAIAKFSLDAGKRRDAYVKAHRQETAE